MPEDVSYCRTSQIYDVLYLVLFFCFSCHYFVSEICRVFLLKVTIHGRSTIYMNSKHYSHE